jgi:hypothetical protein
MKVWLEDVAAAAKDNLAGRHAQPGPDSDILASVAGQFEIDTASAGNGLVKNRSFSLREVVRSKYYRGGAERARRQRATT